MTPKQVARARRIIGRPWYAHFRAWKMHKMFEHWDHILTHSRMPDDVCCRHIYRYAKKEAWYKRK